MNKQERITLEDMANELAFEAIRELGLHREIENSEWDSLAEQFGKELLESLKDKIGQKFIEIGEQRREEREAA